MATLKVSREVMGKVKASARAAGGNECMGLLASPAGSGVVTEMLVLPSVASAACAEAAPVGIKRCADDIARLGLVPRGIWHSHGHLGVFHSSTDQDTIRRLLPAMAAWNFERPQPLTLAPTVTACDEAILPLADGRILAFVLTGSPIHGMEASERSRWASVLIGFAGACQEPQAMLNGSCLRLAGGSTVVDLGIPDGASLTCCRRDCAPLRLARLYSLVVNSRGEACAEYLTLYEVDGSCLSQLHACEVELVEVPDVAATPGDHLDPIAFGIATPPVSRAAAAGYSLDKSRI